VISARDFCPEVRDDRRGPRVSERKGRERLPVQNWKKTGRGPVLAPGRIVPHGLFLFSLLFSPLFFVFPM
jgi:hypothetical protein